MMPVKPPKNSILITMTIIDEHGIENIQRQMATTMREAALSNTFELRAASMANEFRQVCAGMGYFDAMMPEALPVAMPAAARISPDGGEWIKWNGRNSSTFDPVFSSAVVEVVFRNGCRVTAVAKELYWARQNERSDIDIVAYRVVKP